MSKRKGTISEKASDLKKPRLEVSIASLLGSRSRSLLRSRQHILSSQEETDQKIIEREFTAEIELVLDHITEENAHNVEKELRRAIKRDKAKKTQNFRFTAACLSHIFEFLLNNSSQLSVIVNTALISCFKIIKIESFSDATLKDFSEKFVTHTIRKNDINAKVISLISIITKAMTKKKATTYMNVHSMFFDILNICTLNENILLALLKILNSIYHSGSDPKKAELLLNTIFRRDAEKKSNTDDSLETLPTYVNREVSIEWSLLEIETLIDESIHVVNKYTPYMREFIYENLMQLIIFSKKTLKLKSALQKLESSAIGTFMDEISNESKQRKENSRAFSNAFEKIIEQHSLKATLNRFFVHLYISAIDHVENPFKNQLNKAYLDNIQKIFTECLFLKHSRWLESCALRRNLPNELMNIFDCCRIDRLQQSNHVKSLINICLYVLDKYIDTDCSVLMKDPSNASEYFSQFVTSIFIQIIKSKKEKGLVNVIQALLNECFASFNQSVFINHLEIIMANKHAHSLINSMDESSEISKLRKSVIQRLTGHKLNLVKSRKDVALNQLESVDMAARLLDAIGPLLMHSKSELANLIVHINSFGNENCEKSQKVSVRGLISVFRSINQLKIRDVTSNVAGIKQLASETIIDFLRKVISKYDKHEKHGKNEYGIIAELKSIIYQSFCKMAELNKTLIPSIASILLNQLTKVCKRENNIMYFDIGKCFAGSGFVLVEPVDVLLHCTCLFMNKIPFQEDVETNKTIEEIAQMIKSINLTYLNNSPHDIFEIYKNQIIDKLMQQENPAKSMFVLFQLELGLIDAFTEYVIINKQYTHISKMLDQHDTVSGLISNEIEELSMKQHSISGKLKRKRDVENNPAKKENSFKCGLKRLKSKKMSLEGLQSKREPFADVTNKVSQSKKEISSTPIATNVEKIVPSVSQAINQKSYANIQFEHMPRISNSCCIKMLEIFQCTNSNTVDIVEIFHNDLARDALVSLVINPRYAEYVIRIIEKKIKTLVDICDGKKKGNPVYDPEMYQHEEFSSFLSDIWVNMCQKINGTSNDNGKSIFSRGSKQNFGQAYLVKTYKFLTICQNIWRIANKKSQTQLLRLIENERKIYASSDPDLTASNSQSTDRSLYSKLCWKFMLNCTKTVKLYLSPTGLNQSFASKCCSKLLDLMLDILKTTSLTSTEYNNFYHWVTHMADQSIACEGDVFKSIINLLIYLSNKTASQVIMIKYLALDYKVHMSSIMDGSLDETYMIDDDVFSQFNLVSRENSGKFLDCVVDNLIDYINELKALILNVNDFDKSRLMASLCKQLDPMTLTINYFIESIYSRKTAGVIIKLISEFYDLMTVLFDSKLVKDMNDDESSDLKELVEFIMVRLQATLGNQWPSIKDFIVNEEEAMAEKANMEDILRYSDYERSIAKLEESTKKFEKKLSDFHKMNKAVNILENYTIFVNNLNLSFDSKITKTISVSQFNDFVET